MNANQNVNVLDEKKRKELTLKIIELINKSCKTEKYTDQQINEFLNDKSIYEKHETAIKVNELPKIGNKYYTYANESELKEGNTPETSRISYMNYKIGDDIDTYMYNKSISHKYTNPITKYSVASKQINKMMISVENQNDKVDFNELNNYCKDDYTKTYLGWNYSWIMMDVSPLNPKMKVLLDYNQNYLETNTFFQLCDFYASPLSLFIPAPNGQFNEEALSKETQAQIYKMIDETFPDLFANENKYHIEFIDPNEENVNKEPVNHEGKTEDKFFSDLYAVNLIPTMGGAVAEMLKKYKIEPDFFRTKVFMKEGNPITFSEVIDNYVKNKTLGEGVTLEPINPELLEDVKDTDERLVFEAKIFEYKELLQSFKQNRLGYDEPELKENIKNLLENYKTVEFNVKQLSNEDDDDLRLNTNKLILDFKNNEINKSLIKKIDNGIEAFNNKNIETLRKLAREDKEKTDQFIAKKEEAQKEEEALKIKEAKDTEKYFKDSKNDYQDKNFGDFALECESFLNQLNSKPQLKPLDVLNIKSTKVANNKRIQEAINFDYRPITISDIRKATLLLKEFQKRKEKYNDFGAIRKSINKDAYNLMTEKFNNLANFFNEHGVYEFVKKPIYDEKSFIKGVKSFNDSINSKKKSLALNVKKGLAINKINEDLLEDLEESYDYHKKVYDECIEKCNSLKNQFFSQYVGDNQDIIEAQKNNNFEELLNNPDKYQKDLDNWINSTPEGKEYNETDIKAYKAGLNVKLYDQRKKDLEDASLNLSMYKPSDYEAKRKDISFDEKKPVSIIEDVELRKKVAWEICKKLNEKFPTIYSYKYSAVMKEIGGNDLLNEYNQSKPYSEKGETLHEQQELVHNLVSEEKGKTIFLHRKTYTYLKEGDDIETFMDNYEFLNDVSDQKILDAFNQDCAFDILNVDMENYYNKDFSYQLNQLKNNFAKSQTGMVVENIFNDIETKNPSLAKILQWQKGIVENTIGMPMNAMSSNPMHLLLPSEVKMDGISSEEVSKVISGVLNRYNIKEINEAFLDDKDQQLAKYCETINTVNLQKKNCDLVKNIVEKNNCGKDYLLNKVFMKDGQPIKANTVMPTYGPKLVGENGELLDGVTIADIDPEILKDAKDTAERIKFEGQIAKFTNFMNEYSDDELGKGEEVLFNNIKNLLNEYNLAEEKCMFAVDADQLKERTKINEIILGFKNKKEIGDLIDSIKEGMKSFKEKNKEVLIERAKEKLEKAKELKIKDEAKSLEEQALEKDIKENTATFFENNIRDVSDISFKSLSTKCTQNINTINSLPEDKPEQYDKIMNSGITGFNGYDKIKDANYHVVDINTLKNTLVTLAEINEKDAEYNDYGFIRRNWYKNSHNAMVNKKAELVNILKSFGIREDKLNEFNGKSNPETFVSGSYRMMNEMRRTARSYCKMADNILTANEITGKKLKERFDAIKTERIPDLNIINEIHKKFINDEVEAKRINQTKEFAFNTFDNYKGGFNEWLAKQSKETQETYNLTNQKLEESKVLLDTYLEGIENCKKANLNGKRFDFKVSTMKAKRFELSLKKDTEVKVVNVEKAKDNTMDKNLNKEVQVGKNN